MKRSKQIKFKKGENKMKTKKTATKTKKVAVKDQYGFRSGSHVSKLFAALLKGAEIEALKMIAGSVTSKTIAEFKKSPKASPRGRSAKIEVNEKGIWKIKSHS
jgi:hypothetical protein